MFQRFVQVFLYVVDMLDAERKPQQVGIYARSGQFLFAELGVGGRCGVYEQRFRVADVSQMADQTEVVYDLRRLLRTAFHTERQHF